MLRVLAAHAVGSQGAMGWLAGRQAPRRDTETTRAMHMEEYYTA